MTKQEPSRNGLRLGLRCPNIM